MGINTVFNFSAGPAMLPKPVVAQIQKDLPSWYKGMSVMELGHRIPQVIAMAKETQDIIKDLLQIPDNFKILFMQGGARTQFSAVPLNLLGENKAVLPANYLITGHWSSQAAREAEKYTKIHYINNVVFLPKSEVEDTVFQYPAAYIHLTDNETIDGVELAHLPVGPAHLSNPLPLVIDATSSILTKTLDFNNANIGLVYAASQKNLGIAGLTLVIVRDDLIGKAHPLTPKMLDYFAVSQSDSMLNTPPVFVWYVMNLVVKWVQEQGGVPAMETRALEKSKLLYDTIDNSSLYTNTVDPKWRSRLNISFRLANNDLESRFLKEAEENGLYYLKGHKVLGGIRASLYNAMPLEGVQALVKFMKAFETQHSVS